MKMLNTFEAKFDDMSGQGARCATSAQSILLAALSGDPHMSVTRLLGGAHGTCWKRPCPGRRSAALARDEIELLVQVNGKLRGVRVSPAAAHGVEGLSAQPQRVQRFVAGQS